MTLSALVGVLMAVASGSGLLVDELYRDNELVRTSWVGNDVVTMLIAVPVLFSSIAFARFGSTRARLVILAMLGYALYNYAFYLFGAAFNAAFLVYAGILIASTLALMSGLTSRALACVREEVRISRSDRGVGLLIAIVALGPGVVWAVTSLAYVSTGQVPAIVTATAHPTNLTGALDLWLVVTFGLLGGIWLLLGRPWGYVVSVVWSGQAAVYMAALSAATVWAYRSQVIDTLSQLGVWIPVGVVSAAGFLKLLSSCPRPAHPWSSASG